MQFNRNGNTINGEMEGPIGESCLLFTIKLDQVTQINLDMSKVTSINSIGVKHWIMWTLRIPRNCLVAIINCPYVIVSQASTVVGFVTPAFKIESFRAPFTCEDCSHEEICLLSRGKEYEYAISGSAPNLALPEDMICGKCRKGKMEPDFLPEKTFKFLK